MTASQLLQFAKQYTKYCSHRYTPLSLAYGLSMRELNVLLFLANHPDYDTARDITEYKGISKSQVSQAVDFLVETDYLTRRTDAEDRRVVHLRITQAGWEVARQAQDIQNQCGQALLEGMTEAQVQTLHELWTIMMANSERLAGEVGQ